VGVFADLLGRKWYAKYRESSLAIPSPEFGVLQNCARDHSVILSIGIIEKCGGTLYCTAVIIGKDGTLLGRHRKVICPPPFSVQGADGLRIAHPDGGRASCVGQRLRRVSENRRYWVREDRRIDMLGELHACCPHGLVPTRCRVSCPP